MLMLIDAADECSADGKEVVSLKAKEKSGTVS